MLSRRQPATSGPGVWLTAPSDAVAAALSRSRARVDTRSVTARWRTHAVAAVAWIGTAVVVGCVLLLVVRGRSLDVLYGLWIILNAPSAVLALSFGALVLQRSARHGAGRILLTMGVLNALHVVAATVADAGLVAAGHPEPLSGAHGLVPADLPAAVAMPLLVMNVLWVPAAVLALLLLAYFPDGALRGPRWRWVAATAAAAAFALMVAMAIDAWPTADWLELDDGPPVLVPLLLVGGGLALASAAGGAVTFVLRWRDSGAERRRFEVVGGALIAFALVAILTYPWPSVWTPLVHVGLGVMLAVYGIAIARFRLHEVEPVIGKGAVTALVSVVAVAAYLTIVVGVGRLIGARTQDPVLPLVAVAIVALLVEPVRRLLRRWLDRMLYGDAADRDDVLSRLTDPTASGRPTATDVAELVVRATGASRAEVDIGGSSAAAAGSVAAGPALARAAVGELGEIRVYAHAAADLRPGAARLLNDVARLLFLVLDNERLTVRLAEELSRTRDSRQRIVEAQDAARRGLERDLHDGAQAQLIAIRMHLGELARGDPKMTDIDAALAQVVAEVESAIRQLRRLARGLHPPVLDQLGVVAAIGAHVRDASLPVKLESIGSARYPRAVEGAAYLACLEVIQNAMRHAEATSITVEVDSRAEELVVSIADDGCGFDPEHVAKAGLDGLDDRVSALGGRTEVSTAVGQGTQVTIHIPVSPPAQPETAAR